MPLCVHYADSLTALMPAARNAILGMIGFGTAVQRGEWPALTVDLQSLAGGALEVWASSHAVRYGCMGDIAYAEDGEALFGVMTANEAAFSSLESCAQDLYGRLFGFLDASAYHNLFRVWNYLPRITGHDHGMERYRRFNIGRHAAFAQRRREVAQPPAATGIGSLGGETALYFLAIKGDVTAIENPRQVSAYHYPADYGPRSPTFSRAGIGRAGAARHLAISGTASIVGHASLHPGDVEAQTRETIENIRILLSEAEKRGVAVRATELSCKIYIRNPGDFSVVRGIVEEELSCQQTCYLQADICRPELLVEIEAFA